MRYARLLEGLEVSEANYGALERTKRIDAEYFSPPCLQAVAELEHRAGKPLTDFVYITDGNHFSISDDFAEEGVPYFRGQDVTGAFFMEQATPNRISVKAFEHPHMQRSHLKRGDVLLSIVGTIGESALYSADDPATCSCKLAILRPLQIAPEYLAIFLKSKQGRLQVLRLTRGAIQGSLLLEDMDQLLVPRFDQNLENRISKLVLSAQETLGAAQSKLMDANTRLLGALGLENWKPPEPLSYTRRSSEAISAGRLDAEHFRPKFAALLDKMSKRGTVKRLGSCLRFCERGRQPQYAEKGLPVINSRHVRANQIELDNENRLALEDEAQLEIDIENRLTIKMGDVLLNGTGVGTMGRCAPYLHDQPAIPDNHVTILRLRPDVELDSVFLSVQLNSLVGQMQVEQYFKGSSGQIELYPNEIKEFWVWLPPIEFQRSIRTSFEEAHAARQEAQDFLGLAKRAVEVAIEQGEAASNQFLATIKGLR